MPCVTQATTTGAAPPPIPGPLAPWILPIHLIQNLFCSAVTHDDSCVSFTCPKFTPLLDHSCNPNEFWFPRSPLLSTLFSFMAQPSPARPAFNLHTRQSPVGTCHVCPASHSHWRSSLNHWGQGGHCVATHMQTPPR